MPLRPRTPERLPQKSPQKPAIPSQATTPKPPLSLSLSLSVFCNSTTSPPSNAPSLFFAEFMDGNENPPPPPSLRHAITRLSVAALSHLSSLSAHPLFSTAFAFYALVLLYFPRIFIRVLLSPVLAVTAVSLLALLRLGAAQRAREAEDSAPEESSVGTEGESGELGRDSSPSDGRPSEADPRSEVSFAPSTRHECWFVEWDVKAPLEVIYEEYEGEGDEEGDDDRGFSFGGIERYPSLSMCYPDSDSDSSSPGGDFSFNFGSDSPEGGAFRWDSEDGGEGLIEIPLDLHVGEEDNLIEIDISPARKYRSERLD